MWKYEITEEDAQRVLGEAWDLGEVRVCKEAYCNADGSLDFFEQLLTRHLHQELSELQAAAAAHKAIEQACAKRAGYVTFFNYGGAVYSVRTHAGNRTTDVTVAEEDVFCRTRVPFSFQDLAEEQMEQDEEWSEEQAETE